MNLEFLKRTTFWATLGLVVGAWLTFATGYLPAEWAAWATAIATGAYALSRGLSKYNNDLKNGVATTEFWAGIAGTIVIIVAAYSTELSAEVAQLLALIQWGVYALARGIAHSPEEEVDF